MSKANMKMALGFIGGGMDSAVGTAHKIAVQMDGKFQLVAGCFSIDKNINRQTGEQWQTQRTYSNWQALLKSEKDTLAAVVVLTPTNNHTEIVVDAIKAGYPVICEKALTANVADSIRIKRILGRHKGYLAVTYNYTGYPMIRELKSLIKEGRFGRIQQIHIEMPQEGFSRIANDGLPIKPQNWRLHDGQIPTVSLDLGVHLHNLVSFLVGEKPQELIATQNSFGSFKQIIDNVVCIAKYTNNLLCNVWYGKTALGHRNGLRVRLYGKKGAAEWYQMDPERLLLSDNKGRTQIIDRGSSEVSIAAQPRYARFKAGHPAGYIEAFANIYGDIADSLTGYNNNDDYRSQYVFGIDDALDGLYMLEAIAKSAKSKSWEKVNSSG